MANDVSDALLKAMSIVANQATSNQNADISIKAIIKSRIDSSTGQYLATYNGGDITIFDIAASTNIYSPGTQVYVLVPEGNFSNKKYIIGAVSNEDKSYSAEDDIKLSNYNIVGKNCIIYKVYRGENNEISSLKSVKLNSSKANDAYYCYGGDSYEYDTYDYPVLDIDDFTLTKNLENSEAVLFRANFRTMLPRNAYGNYGVTICVTEDETESEKKYYTLDATKMTGDPMNYVMGSNQYLIIPVSSPEFFKIQSITAFSEGFYFQEKESNEADIFIDNIELYALNEQIVIDGKYKFMLNTINGNRFSSTSKTENLTVTAKLLENGIDVSDEATYYWGVQDNKVVPGKELYNPALGSGYADLKKNGKSFSTSGAECIAAENRFKCVVDHRSKKMSQEFIIYNDSNFVDFKIESSAGTSFRFEDNHNVELTCVETYVPTSIEGVEETEIVEELENLTYEWSSIQQDGSQILFNSIKEESENSPQNAALLEMLSNIDFPEGINGSKIIIKEMRGNFNRYRCSVYSDGQYVGCAEIFIQDKNADGSQNCYLRIDGDNQVIQYNETGEIETTTGKLISPKLIYADSDSVVPGYTIKWIFPAEETLIVPPQNARKDGDVYIYEGSEYELKYSKKYNVNSTNNTIQIIVEYQGQTYSQNVSLLFTKVGSNGTNGTSTVVKINELIKGDKSKLAAIYSDGSWIWNDVNRTPLSSVYPFEATLYNNLSNYSDFSTQWKWVGKENNLLSIYSNGNKPTLIGTTNQDDTYRCQTLQAEIMSGDKTYFGYYNLPTIEYQDGCSHLIEKISISESECLDEIIYKSSGSLSEYNSNKGIAINVSELSNPTIRWTAESGKYTNPYKNSLYHYLSGNFKITESPQDAGSLLIESNFIVDDDVKSFIDSIKKYYSIEEQTDAYIDSIIRILESEDSVINKNNELQNLIQTFKVEEDSKNHIGEITAILTKMLKENEEKELIKNDALSFFNKSQTDIIKNWSASWPNIISPEENGYGLSVDEIINMFKPFKGLTEEHILTLTKPDGTYEIIDTSNWKNAIRIFGYQEEESEADSSGNIIELFVNKNLLQISNINPSISEYVLDGAAILDYYEDTIKNFQSEINSVCQKYSSTTIIVDEENDWEEIDNEYIEDGSEQIMALEDSEDNENNLTGSTLTEISYEYTYDEFLKELEQVFNYYQSQILSVSSEIGVKPSWYDRCKKYLSDNAEKISKIYVIPNQNYNGIYCNNNVVARIFDNGEYVAKVTIPIYIHMNQYELSSINGWDGTSIEINEDSGYMLAPQIGAGIKNSSTNTFTGVVMGVLGNPTADGYNSEDQVGLMGFKDGKQSIFLDAKTGNATFGLAPDQGSLSDGRIELIPGGVSTIANWKIGQSFLYNIPDGTYEVREDEDDRDGYDDLNIMVPHDKSGIILSADNPYISIKGKTFTEKEIATFIKRSEYENINPDDSFEVRLNPANNSLFSIMHHSDGLAGHDIGKIKFGVIENYTEQASPQRIINFKNDDTHGLGCLFVTFLVAEDADGNPILASSRDDYYFTNTNTDTESDRLKVILLSESTIEPRADNGYNGEYVLKIYPDFVNTEVHPYIDFIEIVEDDEPIGDDGNDSNESSNESQEEPLPSSVKYYKYIRTLNTKAFPVNDFGEFKIGDNQKFSREQLESDTCLNWQEYIRVGIDDTGQLMNKTSTGVQVNSRLSRINAFGQMAGLYGQQLSFVKDNQPTVLLKIISNDTDNTYITAGADDNKTINVLTSGESKIIIGHCGDSAATSNLTAPKPKHGLVISKDGVYIIKDDGKNYKEVNLSEFFNLIG